MNKATVWTLTIDDDESVKTTAHGTESEAYAALRAYLGPDAANIAEGDLIDYATEDAGVCLWLDAHRVTVKGEN